MYNRHRKRSDGNDNSAPIDTKDTTAREYKIKNDRKSKNSSLDLVELETRKRGKGRLLMWLYNQWGIFSYSSLMKTLMMITLVVMAVILIKRALKTKRTYIEFFNPDTDTSLRRTIQPYNQTIKEKADVCFVSAAYSKRAEDMDKIVGVKNKSPYLRFFLFTNLNDKQWETPGWHKLTPPLKYRRRITYSRFGKFLGWKMPHIRESCKVVFYFDSCLFPNNNQTLWRELARQISNSESGLMQKLHPKNRSGVLGEFLAIQNSKKDIESNIIASLKWMIAQPDFDPKAPVYENDNFGYDPNNKVYQKISQAFWDRYSLELDSWRDQPLWAFMMHRYNITPVPLPYKELTKPCTGRMGYDGHEYHSEEDVLV